MFGKDVVIAAGTGGDCFDRQMATPGVNRSVQEEDSNQETAERALLAQTMRSWPYLPRASSLCIKLAPSSTRPRNIIVTSSPKMARTVPSNDEAVSIIGTKSFGAI